MIILVVFVAFKIPHLSLAYYWDECYPYMPAIAAMHCHGISLLPSAVVPELSKGHPLFFHALAACWMKLFGSSHIAMHSFALGISLLFFISVFEVCARLFNVRVANLALLLFATQVSVFVQSSFVLPELLLGLLSLWAVYGYTTQRYLLSTISLTALFLTKESGMVVGLVLGIYMLISLFSPSLNGQQKLRQLLALAVPGMVTLLFFLIQYRQRGWVFYPEHIQMLDWAWKDYWFKFRMSCIYDLFYSHYRYLYFLLPMALSIVAAIKTRKLHYLSIWLPAIDIFYFVNDMRAGRLLPSVPFFIVFLASVAVFLYYYTRKSPGISPAQRRFTIVTGATVLAYALFSAANFYTSRYLTGAMALNFIVLAIVTDSLIAATYKWMYAGTLIVFAAVSAYAFATDTGHGDCDLGAFDAVRLEQHTVSYMETHADHGATIYTPSFLLQQQLTNKAAGFISTSPFTSVSMEMNGQPQWVLLSNIETEDDLQKSISGNLHYTLTYHENIGTLWISVYHSTDR